MFRECLLRLAILALLFLIFLLPHDGGSLGFNTGVVNGFTMFTPLEQRREDSAIHFATRLGHNSVHRSKAFAGTSRLPNSARFVTGRTSLAGLASKNSVAGDRNTGGPLKEKRSNNNQKRGNGGLNIIRLGRRNRNRGNQRQQQKRRGNERDGKKDLNGDGDEQMSSSAYGPEPMLITERTQPNRGRWRRLRILRLRLRKNDNDAQQNEREEPMPSSSSDGRSDNRNNKNRRRNRRGNDGAQQRKRRRKSSAETKRSDSDHAFSVASDEITSYKRPMSQSPSIAEESINIIPATDITGEDSSSKKSKNRGKDPPTTDTISKKDDTEKEEEQTDDDEPSDNNKEKRISWSATAKSTRVLKLDNKGSALLNKYMTQPVEQYSVITFYGDADGDDASTESGGDGGGEQVGGRRWLIRRLTDKESAPYRSKEDRSIPNFRKRRRETKEGEEENPAVAHDSSTSVNFFRLAVPLMPLIGLDLTPVIDVEVIPPAFSTLATLKENLDHDDKKASNSNGGIDHDDNDSDEQNRRVGIMSRFGDGAHDDVVRIQSLRVSLLSTEEEVSEIMREKSSTGGPFRKQRNGKSQVTKPSATAVSKNKNVRKMGYEAIHMVDKLAEVTQPHLYFESEITWNNEGKKNKKRNKENYDCAVTVKSTVATSVTIPPLPIAFPLPTGLFVSKIGSTITKRVLKLVLPRFLRLLESDFKRWASIDTNEKTSDE